MEGTRYLCEFDNAPATVERVIKKLGKQVWEGTVLLRSWTNGLRLYRQIIMLGNECTVVAPSLIPRRPETDQDQSTRCSDPGAVVSSGRTDLGLGPPDAVHEAVWISSERARPRLRMFDVSNFSPFSVSIRRRPPS
jgi:transposase